MDKQTSPAGRTFRERWPDDAAEADRLVRPWIPIVLGGLAGLVALPVLLAAAFLANPVPMGIGVAGGASVLGVLLGSRLVAAPVRRVWSVLAWVALAAAVGLVVGIVTGTLCAGDATAACLERRSPMPAWVAFVLCVAGSTGAAMAVDRLGRPLERAGRAAPPAA